MNFQIFRMNILARRQDDHVLRPADDMKMPVLIDPAQIAGAKPAIRGESFIGGSGIAIVSLENDRALYQDLAHAFLVQLSKLYLGAFHRFPNGADTVVVLVRCRRCAACFGESITLNDRESQIVEIACDVVIEARSGSYGKSEFPAERIVYSAEKDASRI